MILVTGASGKTGKAVIRALVSRGAAVRGFVRRAAQIDSVMAAGAREAVAGDLGDAAALTDAAQGATAIYHICPNVLPHEVAYGRALIAAAHAAGVRRVAYHSLLHPAIEAMPHHWDKMRVEEMLFATGLDVVILQPTTYMQNMLAGWRSIVEDGVYRVPYPVASRISLVDLDDVAAVAAIVLTEPGHTGASYELVGTKPLSQVEVATALGEALGRPVRAEQEPIAAWDARVAGIGDTQRDTLKKMFGYYERHGITGCSNVLRWLLGRPPTTVAEFARRTAAPG